MRLRISHRLNAPGDFYVEDGCCTGCEVPFNEAPGHFGTDKTGHCFVCKQPSTSDEVQGMICAIAVSEVGCIRYAGDNPEVLRELKKHGNAEQCDALFSERYPWNQPSVGLVQRIRELWQLLRRR
jgi:hypothetical protein